MEDPFDLRRFVTAQESVYSQVCEELMRGRKQTHWMWFIFPQLKGLGQSSMAVKYGIQSVEEASAYLDHPILGSRLRECTELVNKIEGESVDVIFGHPDDLKFHSSMTLFLRASGDDQPFAKAIAKYFGGELDQASLDLL